MPKWLEPHLGFLRSTTEDEAAFFARVADIFPPTDTRYAFIHKAYKAAEKQFEMVRRDGGQQYFEHLRAVGLTVMVYLRVRDPDIIAAGLLHDMVEDFPNEWSIDRIAAEFNPRVASIVWWVTKPMHPRYKTREDVDRKYHRQLREAPREAIIVKLADRLHNLITIWVQKPEKILRKALETRDFLLPLAEQHTLLIYELEGVLQMLEKQHRV